MSIKKTMLLFALVIALLIQAHAENLYYENATYIESIKTVQAHREGLIFSNPIIGLNEEARLVFKFDDLSPRVKDYYYTIVHCDADWNESFMAQTEYIEGFVENPVDDYALSYNTSFEYVNYQIRIPNRNLKLRLSGNYALVVYEDGNKEKKILTQRFYVHEHVAHIQGIVRKATEDAFKGTRHEVDFEVYHPNLHILNPRDEVKVVLMQNYRWDNAIRNLKPLYIREGRLDYNYNHENVFYAGNQFRYFDNRTNRMNGENVFKTDFYAPYYHKTLVVDELRANKNFFYYEEMNGKYSIESQDQEVRDVDTECDYAFVHFSLELTAPLVGGSVNVFGALTQWNANRSNEMTYNFDNGTYELSLLLKQGYYNYQYVYVPEGSMVADHTNIEGSFWEADNDYQIMVYYRDLAGRYDRLVGYTELNSMDRRR